ncbi:hypothetical protein FEM48_Zijuj04G0176600 [Ziziphus jujuba var. spinosa]|uniref:Uncharacterized protein n=1 Tax=Ziziphus jujuba var. spinosa TaxID=714518 RepID=A0A978VL91_ZIZJJ|nr:hypothetical protein FEM48_Zijuj04G0176600 [Ziziphus jujuba var. spinosa]
MHTLTLFHAPILVAMLSRELGTYASTSALPVLNRTFNVTLRANERFQILQEQDEGVILILNDSSELLGSLLTVSWMWHCSFSGFFYDIVKKPRETLFDYKSCT